MSNAYEIAREVVHEACESHDGDYETVLNQRFGATHGGVAHAHRKIRTEVRAEIEAFYAPREAPEPDIRYGW